MSILNYSTLPSLVVTGDVLRDSDVIELEGLSDKVTVNIQDPEVVGRVLGFSAASCSLAPVGQQGPSWKNVQESGFPACWMLRELNTKV